MTKKISLKTEFSEHIIYLTHSQVNVLKQYKANQGVRTVIVCCSSVGTYMMPRNIRRTMQLICKQADLKPIRFHDLRHTHGTMFLHVTRDVKATQQRLGHADVRMTLDRYVHSSDTIQKQTSEQLSNFMVE